MDKTSVAARSESPTHRGEGQLGCGTRVLVTAHSKPKE